MGRIFLEHMSGDTLYSCAACDANLSNSEELFSTNFEAGTDHGYLFNKVINLKYGYGATLNLDVNKRFLVSFNGNKTFLI